MKKLRVFLDTNVLLQYIKNGTPEKLFSNEIQEKVVFVINPVVLQELILASARKEQYKNWVNLADDFEVSSIDGNIFENESVKRLIKIRNRAVHSSDFLIMASAVTSNCDYLLSHDREILASDSETSVSTVSPEEFLQKMENSK